MISKLPVVAAQALPALQPFSVLCEGVLFALEATKDPSSPLYAKIDESRIVVAGHSMGATDSIEAECSAVPAARYTCLFRRV